MKYVLFIIISMVGVVVFVDTILFYFFFFLFIISIYLPISKKIKPVYFKDDPNDHRRDVFRY